MAPDEMANLIDGDTMRKSIRWGALMAVPALAAAAATAPLSFQSGSRVWVDGTSTVRSFHCVSTTADGGAVASTTDLAHLTTVSHAQVSVQVASLDCRNGTMNGHMRKALKADASPTISFRASSVEVAATSADAGTARLVGTLSMGGTERPVTIDATVARVDGQLRVRGTKPLLMTEWGLRPPSLMMGTMRVNPNVTVGFDVLLKP
ncbi:MAG TPA: YceI family protein [Longimicrobiaceae bacterium]|nr:YceI family protein [Longimicrobiaceae bacterium]